MDREAQEQQGLQQFYNLAFNRKHVQTHQSCTFKTPTQEQRGTYWNPACLAGLSLIPLPTHLSPSLARPQSTSSFSVFSSTALQKNILLSASAAPTSRRDACNKLQFPLTLSCCSFPPRTSGGSSASLVFASPPLLVPHMPVISIARTPRELSRRHAATAGPAAAWGSFEEVRNKGIATAIAGHASLSCGTSSADTLHSTLGEDVAASGGFAAGFLAQTMLTMDGEGQAAASAAPRTLRNLVCNLTCLPHFSLTAGLPWKFSRGGAAADCAGGISAPCGFAAAPVASESLDLVESPLGLHAAIKSPVPLSCGTKYSAASSTGSPFYKFAAAAAVASSVSDITAAPVVGSGFYSGGGPDNFVDYGGQLVVRALTGAPSFVNVADYSSSLLPPTAATADSATSAAAGRRVAATRGPDNISTPHSFDSVAAGLVPSFAAGADLAAVQRSAGVPAPPTPFAAAEDRASTSSSPFLIADASSSATFGNGHVLLRRLAADAIAAGAAGACVAPVVTVIDRSIVRRAAGVDRLWNSVFSGMQHMLLHPLRFMAGRDFRIVLGVYMGTYAAANGAESVALCYGKKSTDRTSADVSKFIAATAANMYLCIRKDIIFARLFGRRTAMPGYPYKGSSNNNGTATNKAHGKTCHNELSEQATRPAKDSESARRGDQTATSTNNHVLRHRTPSNLMKTPAAAPVATVRGATAPDTAVSPAPASRTTSAFTGRDPDAAVRGGRCPAVTDRATSAPASAAASPAAGELQTPKSFPVISTLLFVARDSLTIAASFNAPPYIAVWLLKAKKHFSAPESVIAGPPQQQQHPHQLQHLEKKESQGVEEDVAVTPAPADGAASSGKREKQQRHPVREERGGWGGTAEDAAAPKTSSGAVVTRIDSAQAGLVDHPASPAGVERSPQTKTAGVAAPTATIATYGEKPSVQSSSAVALSVAQLLCPVAVQFVSTPLHLLSLDCYNNPSRPASGRWSFLLHTYAGTVAARMARILPAFGVGGIVNNQTRELLQQQLHVSIAAAAAAG